MIQRVTIRMASGAATLLCVYALTFVMVVSIPGNPFQTGERRLSRETQMALLSRYHMDNNWRYFVDYLQGAVLLDFGPSFSYADWTCGQILAASLPVSILIGGLAIVMALTLGVPLGVFCAVRSRTRRAAAVEAALMAAISFPPFVTGTLLLIVFAVYLGWFPIGGWGTSRHLALPAATLSIPFVAYIARLTRAGMLDVLGSDFLLTAAAKGASPRQIIWRHAFRVAFLPVLSYLGPATAQAMTGSFVVEKVFGVPGLGQHFVNAALNRDTGLILATVLVFSAILVAFNAIVDVLYGWLDPRISRAA
jgi:oligopeptide transport system permease protein